MSIATWPKNAPFTNLIDKDSDLVMIYAGSNAWKIARPEGDRVASLVYPKNVDPALYKWPVRGRQVLVMIGDETDKNIAILTVELLNAGADTVHISDGTNLSTYHKPDAQ